MPTKVYPAISNVDSVTSSLLSYSAAACATTGSVSTTETQQRVISFSHEEAQGFTIPGWRKLKNSGVIVPMTPWSQFKVSGVCTSATREWCTSGNQKRIYTNYRLGASYPDPWNLNPRWQRSYLTSLIGTPDLQYAVQKAASKIYSRGWDAGTFLAEIGQLRRMLFGIGRKLNSLTLKKVPKEIHNLWLEGRYGWRVLGYDIRDLAELLLLHNERRTRLRDAGGFVYTGSHTDSSDSTSQGITQTIETNFSWTVNVRGVVVADIDVPEYIFSTLNTAWEVTRLSFVLDWLLNVGQALEATSFLLMVKDYKACGGYHAEIDIDGNASLKSKGSNVSATITGNWSGKAEITERVPMNVGVIPRIKLRLDKWKVLDLLALIRQRV